MRKWIIGAFIIAALAGCKSTDTQNAAPVEEGAPTATTPATGGATTAGTSTPGVSGTPAGAGPLLRSGTRAISCRSAASTSTMTSS